MGVIYVSRKDLGILEFEDLVPLGLDPNCITGMFFTPEIPLDYVKWNPECHVVTAVETPKRFHYLNYFEPRGLGFFIAEGDPNPRHYYKPKPLTKKRFEEMSRELIKNDGGTPSRETKILLSLSLRLINGEWDEETDDDDEQWVHHKD